MNSKNYKIVNYSDGMKDEVLSFLSQAFEEAGKKFEVETRHKIYADIPGNFEMFLCNS